MSLSKGLHSGGTHSSSRYELIAKLFCCLFNEPENPNSWLVMHLQLKMVTIDHFALVYSKRHTYFC
jgi:hypothetical protein